MNVVAPAVDGVEQADEAPLVMVIQMGARRGYELARMLESRNALSALQTSLAWVEGEGPSPLFRRLSGAPDSVVKRRTVRGVPASKVQSTRAPEIAGAALGRLGLKHRTRLGVEDWLLGFDARRRGLGDANIVLNTAGNGGVAFLRWARAEGLRVATDIVITPLASAIAEEERRIWPGWETAGSAQDDPAMDRRHDEAVIAASDLLLSPSDTVDDGLAQLSGFDPGKLVRVPYGLGSMPVVAGRPVPRRVLFAGQAGLRKGIPYLAEAARILAPLGYDIRVAGHADKAVRARPECAALTFLGHLGPDAMAKAFQTADVFCLPSLAEGMARVTLEALANGAPCIVTRAAGSPVRDGHDGRIVAERDGAALAEAIRSVCEDRAARDRMSAAALQTARDHRLEVVGDRLHAVLRDLLCDRA